MRRLEELLRQMTLAAKAIGNSELENKFSEGIVFFFFSVFKLSSFFFFFFFFFYFFFFLLLFFILIVYFLGIARIKRDIIFAASLYL